MTQNKFIDIILFGAYSKNQIENICLPKKNFFNKNELDIIKRKIKRLNILFITNDQKNNKLIIWDRKNLPKNSQNVLLWNKRSDKFNSIINFIDNHSKKIKYDTLELFKDFSKSKIDNLSIIDYYNLENNFSYWNLSFFIEKNFYKKNFFDIIKISALDNLIKKEKISFIFWKLQIKD